MPRPIKCRKVCHFPDILEFRPSNKNGRRGEEDEKEVILLTVDEYETIRLIDKEGYSQEQCAGFMQIARTTVQRIYEIARKKVADAIIDGHPLRIEGGDFRICDGKSSKCGLGGCYKQEFYQKYATEKGEGIMRVAVTYENGQIFQHFGHTAEFKVYDVAGWKSNPFRSCRYEWKRTWRIGRCSECIEGGCSDLWRNRRRSTDGFISGRN